MHGGNVEAALAKALRDNNRLAALARTHPEDFRPSGVADPNAPPVAPAETQLFVDSTYPEAPRVPAEGELPGVAPAVPLNWAEITAEVDRIVTTVDQPCMGLARQWLTNDNVIKDAAKQITEKNQRLTYLTNLLSPNSGIEIPELKAEDLKDERRSLQSEIAGLKQDAMLRVLHNKELDREFIERRQRIHDSVAGHHQEAAQEQVFNAELTQIESAEYQRLSTAWPGALARTVASFGIPADLAQDFGNYAKQMANVALQDPDYELSDVDAFMSEVGRGYMGRLDRYHRAQAATYGHLAVTRAGTPSPTPPPGTPAPVAPSPPSMTPEQAIDEANRVLRQRIRGG